MKTLGLAGWSDSGKTTLLVKLIPALTGRGLSVSTIKHAHHKFDIDRPGKDSYHHREAGAQEVLVSSAHRWALMHEHRGAGEPGLDELLAHLSPVDLVLVEGFKGERHAKIEVHRHETGKPLLATQDDSVIALAADWRPDDVTVPVFALDDIEAIADFIVRYQRHGVAA